MADKGDGKPNPSSNQFLLNAMPAASCITEKTQASYVPGLFGTMTGSSSTMSRNTFSGTPSFSSTSSNRSPITSFKSGLFGASAFKAFESSGSNSTNSSSKSKEIVEADGNITSSGVVSGGDKKEKSGFDDSIPESSLHFHRVSEAEGQTTDTDSDFVGKKMNTNPDESKSAGTDSPKSLNSALAGTTAVPTSCGELPGNKPSLSDSPDGESSATRNLSGSVAKEFARASDEGKNVFDETSSTPHVQSTVSEHCTSSSPVLFCISSSESSSAPHLSGETPSTTEYTTKASDIVKPVSGIGSIIVTTQYGYYPDSIPDVLGDVKKNTRGSVTVSASYSVFGGSSGFTSVSSSIIKLFSGMPNVPLISGIAGSELSHKRNDIPIVSSVESLRNPISAAPSPSDIIKTSINTNTTVSKAKSVSMITVVPTIFGDVASNQSSTSTTSCEDAVSKDETIPKLEKEDQESKTECETFKLPVSVTETAIKQKEEQVNHLEDNNSSKDLMDISGKIDESMISSSKRVSSPEGSTRKKQKL